MAFIKEEDSVTNSREALIHIEDLHKSYYDGESELPVLQGVDFTVHPSEMLAIVGASGVGKSTLLHIIGALDRPTIGSVFYERQDIFALPDKELARFRNKRIGFVFQFHHLLPEFTALENVVMSAIIAKQWRGDSNTPSKTENNIDERARELLAYVGLSERLTHYPSQLSGGERQRVAIARALMNQPKVVLADEPTGNLDQRSSDAMLELLWKLNAQSGQTFIIVTHNQELAERADRIVHLVDGKISEVSE